MVLILHYRVLIGSPCCQSFDCNRIFEPRLWLQRILSEASKANLAIGYKSWCLGNQLWMVPFHLILCTIRKAEVHIAQHRHPGWRERERLLLDVDRKAVLVTWCLWRLTDLPLGLVPSKVNIFVIHLLPVLCWLYSACTTVIMKWDKNLASVIDHVSFLLWMLNSYTIADEMFVHRS